MAKALIAHSGLGAVVAVSPSALPLYEQHGWTQADGLDQLADLDAGQLEQLAAIASGDVIDLATATAKDVVAWAGDDPERIADALAAEKERTTPRKSVLHALEPAARDDGATEVTEPATPSGDLTEITEPATPPFTSDPDPQDLDDDPDAEDDDQAHDGQEA